MKFIALLRGINVGGNNKVSMADLKLCFEKLGFENVQTYINSGNVIFDSEIADKIKLIKMCEESIERIFGFHVICSIITGDELKESLSNAPAWWGDDEDSKHNAIFVIEPVSPEDISKEIGETKLDFESVATYGQIIFWSAPVKTFSRTRYAKIVGTKAYKSVTIRNANTTRKLLELSS